LDHDHRDSSFVGGFHRRADCWGVDGVDSDHVDARCDVVQRRIDLALGAVVSGNEQLDTIGVGCLLCAHGQTIDERIRQIGKYETELQAFGGGCGFGPCGSFRRFGCFRRSGGSGRFRGFGRTRCGRGSNIGITATGTGDDGNKGEDDK
jgi:hypothetical protein